MHGSVRGLAEIWTTSLVVSISFMAAVGGRERGEERALVFHSPPYCIIHHCKVALFNILKQFMVVCVICLWCSGFLKWCWTCVVCARRCESGGTETCWGLLAALHYRLTELHAELSDYLFIFLNIYISLYLIYTNFYSARVHYIYQKWQ